MFKVIKQGDAYRLLYSAKNFSSGLSDVQAIPYNPSGAAQSAVAMTEMGTSGVYYADFNTTGLALGVWGFKIDSTSKSAPAIDKIQIVDPDTLNDTVLEKLDAMLDTTLSNLTTIDGKIDVIDGNVDDIEGIVANVNHGNAALKTLIDAVASAVQSIQNNTLFSTSLQQVMIVPDTGTNTYKVYVNIFDAAGNMEDPDNQNTDAYVAVSVANSGGTDRSGNLGGLSADTFGSKKWLTRVSEGRFSFTYAVSDAAAAEDLIFSFDYNEDSVTKYQDRASRVAAESSDIATKLNTIEAKVDIVDGVVDGIQADLDNSTDGLGALKALIDAVQADIDDGTNGLAAIRTLVSSNNSLLSNATYGLAALKTLLDTIAGNTDGVEADLTAIKGAGWTSDDNLKNIYEAVQPGGIAV